MHAIVVAGLDLVLGSRCAGCDWPGALLCTRCRPALLAVPTVAWPDPAPPGLREPAVGPAFAPWAAGVYVDPLRTLLVAYKDRGRAGLVAPLARMLAAAVEPALVGAPGSGVDLVPVPSARASVRARGRDVVGDLARVTARRLRRRGHEVRTVPLLVPARRIADQAGLSAPERAANLAGAFAARRIGHLRPVVVVDDVLTTGSTAAEAVRVVAATGRPVLAVAVVAATPRHR